MKSFTKPEGKSGILSMGLYNMYRRRFTKYDRNCEAYVPYLTWLRICKKFNVKIMKSVLEGNVFNMPFRLGAIGIIQYKKKIRFDSEGRLSHKGLIPDWAKTKALWKELYPECKTAEDYKKIQHKKVVYRTNEHTDGRVFKFHWKKRYSNIKNISVYQLRIASKYKEILGRMIMENNNIQFCTKF
jgi:hypothetical protein